MLHTKLILIDGLPGSGKSTTAQFIALQLERNHIPARWFYELEQAHPIHAFHVWSREGPAKFVKTIINNWRTFVAREQNSDVVNILESTLFQSTVRLLLQNDVPHSEILEYAFHTEEITRELQPVLIYFSASNVAKALREICDKRRKIWEQYFVRVIDGSLYGKNRQLHDFEGVVTFFQEYQELTTYLFSQFKMKKLALEDVKGNWTECHRQICEFLAIPFKEDQRVSEEYLAQFTGHYKDDKTRLEVEVSLDHNSLIVHDLLWPKSRLIPKEENSFYVEACTLELFFQTDASGAIRTIRIGGSPGWNFHGKVLSKVEAGNNYEDKSHTI